MCVCVCVCVCMTVDTFMPCLCQGLMRGSPVVCTCVEVHSHTRFVKYHCSCCDVPLPRPRQPIRVVAKPPAVIDAVVGEETFVTAQLFDDGSDTEDVTALLTTGDRRRVVPCDVQDNGDGSYVVSFLPRAPGFYSLGFYINGRKLDGSSLGVTVLKVSWRAGVRGGGVCAHGGVAGCATVRACICHEFLGVENRTSA